MIYLIITGTGTWTTLTQKIIVSNSESNETMENVLGTLFVFIWRISESKNIRIFLNSRKCQGGGQAKPELYAIFFLRLFVFFTVVIVSLYILGVYFLNTFHQTFHF